MMGILTQHQNKYQKRRKINERENLTIPHHHRLERQLTQQHQPKLNRKNAILV
jgi:hypothetical protein